jgi:hypothetical protein
MLTTPTQQAPGSIAFSVAPVGSLCSDVAYMALELISRYYAHWRFREHVRAQQVLHTPADASVGSATSRLSMHSRCRGWWESVRGGGTDSRPRCVCSPAARMGCALVQEPTLERSMSDNGPPHKPHSTPRVPSHTALVLCRRRLLRKSVDAAGTAVAMHPTA